MEVLEVTVIQTGEEGPESPGESIELEPRMTELEKLMRQVGREVPVMHEAEDDLPLVAALSAHSALVNPRSRKSKPSVNEDEGVQATDREKTYKEMEQCVCHYGSITSCELPCLFGSQWTGERRCTSGSSCCAESIQTNVLTLTVAATFMLLKTMLKLSQLCQNPQARELEPVV